MVGRIFCTMSPLFEFMCVVCGWCGDEMGTRSIVDVELADRRGAVALYPFEIAVAVGEDEARAVWSDGEELRTTGCLAILVTRL